MIPIAELRIGNLLMQGRYIVTVKGLPCDEFIQYSIESLDNGFVYGEPYKSFDPIPITEKRLNKACFKKHEGYTFKNINLPYWVKDGVLLFFNTGQEEYSFKIGYGEIVEGEYFAATWRWINKWHHLQNAYYELTGGKELTEQK